MSNSPRVPANKATTEPAPWFRVPAKAIVSVEHPCIVKNVDKGITMLGGARAITQIVQNDQDHTLGLNFRPEDPANRKIISINSRTNNVLVKISVLKRTGRKRKRGSDDPFVEDAIEPTSPKDARYLLRSLQDNSQTYDVEPIGSIVSTHNWRSMPDFVYSNHSSPFFAEFRSKILPKQYPQLKEWHLPQTYGLTDTETIPPPVLSTTAYNQNYSYRQNPAVKQVTNTVTGEKLLHNTQAPAKIYTHQCQYDTTTYPTTIAPDCPPLNTQPPNLQTLTTTIRTIFKTRPIWTRRALVNQLPPTAPLFLVRYAIAYVAFALRSGPWRDTYCLFGHDPRTSPAYRKYQTILLQLVPKLPEQSGAGLKARREDYQRTWTRSRDTYSHIFTGTGRIPEDGKVWQLCDITDPQLLTLINIPDVHLRATCDIRYFGWYANGTSAKMRVVLRAKVDDLASNPDEAKPPSTYDAFLALPETWSGPVKNAQGIVIEDAVGGYLPKDATPDELKWGSAYRAMCRAPPGSLPIGAYRLTKSKPETRTSYLEAGSNNDETTWVEEGLENTGGSLGMDVDDEDTAAGFEEPEEGQGGDLDGDGEVVMEVDEYGNLQEVTTASEDDGPKDEDEVDDDSDMNVTDSD